MSWAHLDEDGDKAAGTRSKGMEGRRCEMKAKTLKIEITWTPVDGKVIAQMSDLSAM